MAEPRSAPYCLIEAFALDRGIESRGKKDAASAAERLAASEVEGSALFGEAAFLAAEFISAVQDEIGFRDLDRGNGI